MFLDPLNPNLASVFDLKLLNQDMPTFTTKMSTFLNFKFFVQTCFFVFFGSLSTNLMFVYKNIMHEVYLTRFTKKMQTFKFKKNENLCCRRKLPCEECLGKHTGNQDQLGASNDGDSSSNAMAPTWTLCQDT